jgi:hypothetical protein
MDICARVTQLSSAIALLLIAALAAAQEHEIPRTPWGAPDLNGVWDYSSATPLERPDELAGKTHFTPAEARAFMAGTDARLEAGTREFDLNGFVGVEAWIPTDAPLTDDLRTSLIVQPEDGKIPALTELAKARMEAGIAIATRPPQGPEDRPVAERCILGFSTGPPSEAFFGYNSLLQIFQTENEVAILQEMVNDSRIIPIGTKPHLPAQLRQWKGDSRGHWEGDTLVVETRNFSGRNPFRGSGHQLIVGERFTRLNENQIEYEFTIEDPESFSSPWTARYPIRRRSDTLFEFACHENNRSMEYMLRGARAMEAQEQAEQK